LQVNDQTLTLGNGATLGGVISGAGLLDCTNVAGGANSIYTFAKAVSLGVGTLEIAGAAIASIAASLSYGGIFVEAPNGTIALGSDTLTLSGTNLFSGGVINGPGTVLLSGTSALANVNILAGALVSVTGTATETSSITVGENPAGTNPPATAELQIAKGASYTLGENDSIFGNGTLAVAGTLTAASDGSSQLGPTLVDSGVITANLGTLDILSAVSGSGIFSIGKTGLLEFGNVSTIGASNLVSFTTGGGELLLENPASFNAGLANFSNGDIIELAGFASGSLTGSYANNQHTAITVSDGNDSTTLTFTTAQTLSAISFTVGPNGLAALVHH